MDDEEYYAELRAVAQSLATARREAARRLTAALRDETPDWLLERLDGALRAIDAAERDVGRFIREDRAGISAAPPLDVDDEG
jgi:hypothetical protein